MYKYEDQQRCYRRRPVQPLYPNKLNSIPKRNQQIIINKPNVNVTKKTKKRNNKPRSVSASNVADLTPAQAFVLAQGNAFDPRARGAKIPDFCNLPTATAQMRASNIFGSDMYGYCITAFQAPSTAWTYNLLPTGVSLTGNITWGAGIPKSLPNTGALDAACKFYRVTSYGIKVTCEQPMGTAQGHVYFAHCYKDTISGGYALASLPTSESHMESVLDVVKVPIAELINEPMIITGRIQDTMCTSFRDAAASGAGSAGMQSEGWADIVVYASGASISSTVFSIEYIVNIEYCPFPGSAFQPESGRCAYSARALEACSIVGAMAPPVLRDSDQGQWNASLENFVSSITSGAETVARYAPRLISAAGTLFGAYAGKRHGAVPTVGFQQPYMIRY